MITSITGPPDASPTRHVRTPVSNAKKRRKLQARLRELDMAELVDSDEEDDDEDDADPEDGLSSLPASPVQSFPASGTFSWRPGDRTHVVQLTHNVMHSRADLAYCH